MINKNKFNIKNTKKVLHKVGKKWVVVSAVLLGLAAGGAAVTTANANAAAGTSTPTASTQAPTINVTPTEKTDAQNAIAEARIYRQKGVVNDALNGIGNYIKSGANSATASNAYSSLANMANASNLAHFASGASFGSDTSTNHNSATWIGEFNNAVSDAETINNGRHPKANDALNHVANTLYGLNNQPFALTYNINESNVRLTDLNNSQNHVTPYPVVNSQLPSVYNDIKAGEQKVIDDAKPSGISTSIMNEASNYITEYPSLEYINSNTYIDIAPINNTTPVVSIGGNIGNILDSEQVPVTINANITVHYKGNTDVHLALNMDKINALPNTNMTDMLIKNSLTSSKIKNKINDALFSASTKATNDLNSWRNKTIPRATTYNIQLPNYTANHIADLLDNKQNSGFTASNDSYTTSIPTTANKLKGLDSANAAIMDSTVNSAISSLASSLSASSYTQEAADMLRAGNYIINNGSMSSEYDYIVNQLSNLPNDNEVAESNALNNMASEANLLANSVNDNNALGNVKYDNVNDKAFIVNNLQKASKAANSAATSMSNTIDAINNASTAVSKYPNDVSNASMALNNDFHNGKKPSYNLSSDSATSEMNSDVNAINSDVSAIKSAHSAYSNWADPDNGVESSIASNAETNAKAASANAQSLLSMKSSTAINKHHRHGKRSHKHQDTGYIPINTNSYVHYKASAPVKESANYSAEPSSETTKPAKHVAHYVTVNKALQLHTSPNFTKKNSVAVIEPNTRLDLEKTVKANHGLVRYEVNYRGQNYFITANKKYTNHMSYVLAKPTHYRYLKVGKALQLHTSPYFTKKNGVLVVKPNSEFRINRVVRAHGLVRYEVNYKGNVYFITADKKFSANAYLQRGNFRKHGYKAIKVIKPLNEYRKLSFAKRSLIRHFYRGSVLPVKKVITVANGEMTRLQLTNGRYVTANKNFVEPIR